MGGSVHRSHWAYLTYLAWWVFPTDPFSTEKEGFAEPDQVRQLASSVHKSTAGHFLGRGNSAHLVSQRMEAEQVLILICELAEKSGKDVLPRIDHDRVRKNIFDTLLSFGKIFHKLWPIWAEFLPILEKSQRS